MFRHFPEADGGIRPDAGLLVICRLGEILEKFTIDRAVR